MKNEILEDIKNYAIKKLKNEYGYCGSAEGGEMAIINSDDGDGNDITINIKLA